MVGLATYKMGVQRLNVAFITGIAGQDGAYLADLLLSKGYKVIGGFHSRDRRTLWRLERLGILEHPGLHLDTHDVLDFASTARLITKHMPTEIYNLAAQSFVADSFRQPLITASSTGLGALNVLEAMRITGSAARFYQASSSEMFGQVREVPQSESTEFHPRSPYGVAKLFAHWATVNYRESFGMFASSGILFNHESPLRGPEFVTRKITSSLVRIARGSSEVLELGNLEAQRDWGFAGDYVEGMWLMLQAKSPDNFVLSTGSSMSVRQFLEMAATATGLKLSFEGAGLDEVAFDERAGRVVARVKPEFFRPAEVDILVGNSSKAQKVLGWQPKTNPEQLVELMVAEEFKQTVN
jgi:GDPmannose 4,6-dehydratase